MTAQGFHGGRVVVHAGDCLDVMARLPEASVDAIVTDPPYHLTSIVKRFGGAQAAPAKDYSGERDGATGAFARVSRGFMGQSWDGGDVAFRPETWAAALRLLKPGGHLVAFAAAKNAHRMICAIEDAGFEVRDALMWLYGSGFPKSLDAGAGRGTALKPAYEPICLARKPLSGTVAETVLAYGTGALNIDGCRIAGEAPSIARREAGARTGRIGRCGDSRAHERGQFRANADRSAALAEYLKPRPGEALGRWPANVLHDGGDEVAAALQNAARFFWAPKADAADRVGSRHPTVKPVALMRYLVRLVTPPGGTVLDPFAGTGTTAEAALLEGFAAILIEREADYRADIARRMAHVFASRLRKCIETKKARKHVGPAGPPFAEVAE